ncbi:MAG: HlyD family efflux transporter periplasmic adaptor subunit [Oscillospiraceae bacterium]
METKGKKREWVKTAAILFLAVLLVLTFFSNTIMNRSLPEAATLQVTSGTVTPKVRGTGIVTANETYPVTVERTREVDTVFVKEGDEVSAGDVLFLLSAEESGELSAAQETLRQLQYSYRQALIRATDADYSRENRDIEKAREALVQAQEKLDSLSGANADASTESRDIEKARLALEMAQQTMDSLFTDDAEVQMAALEADRARSAVIEAQDVVEQAQADLDSLGGYSAPDETTLASLYDQMKTKRNEIRDAENALESARLIHGVDYDALTAEATAWIMSTDEYQALSGSAQAAYVSSKLPVFIPATAEKYKDPSCEDHRYYIAYETITLCEQNIASAQAEYDALSRKYDALLSQDNSSAYDKYSRALKQAKEDLAKAQKTLEQREQVLSELQARQAEYESAQAQVEACQTVLEDLLFSQREQRKAEYQAAEAEVEACQTALEDLLFTLSEQQKADSKTRELESLELQEMADKIARQQETVDALLAGEQEMQVTAKVSGVVEAVYVTAGRDAVAGEALATIQVDDMGYSLSVTVTSEQARRVKAGDVADVTNNRSGGSISAVLRSIRVDSQDPQNSRILEFDVSGDVTAGAALSVSVAQKSAEYDCVVPNSALRSDANGSFVYTVTTKNSPLGNRYIATRVDVTVLAGDDSRSAVSGALGVGSYVITTSSKPISNGDKVRLGG